MIQAQPSGDTLVTRASSAFASYRAGDREAFDALVEMTTPLLWHTARGQGIDRTVAEDVLQTVWLNLLHSAEGVRDPQLIVKWLLTATRREAWRVADRRRAADARTAHAGEADDVVAGLPAPEDDVPDVAVLRDSRQRLLWAHVQKLPARCRELLRVIAFADRPDYAHLAESLGMPVGSIGPTRGRCLARLRTQLSDDPEFDTEWEKP